MKVGVFELQKTQAEIITFGVDFTDSLRLDLSESINSHEVKCFDKDGNDVTSSLIKDSTHTNTQVNVQVQNGVNGERYEVYIKATTSIGDVLESKVLLKVRKL